MAKFNAKLTTEKTKNYEGAPSFKLGPEMELYTMVCNSLIEDQYQLKNVTPILQETSQPTLETK